MLCRDIVKIIEKAFPTVTALDFDNVGLLCGDFENDVQKIYISLDVTEQVVDEAIKWGADMLISHHPLLFQPIKSFNSDDYVGGMLLRLAQGNIAYYALHTNYDTMRMNDLVADLLDIKNREILKETLFLDDEPKGLGVKGEWATPMSLYDCCDYVKEKLQIDNVRVYGDLSQRISSVAICPGSGKMVIEDAIGKKVQLLITGDIKHHEGVEAVERGLFIIDAGHYATEQFFMEDMEQFLFSKNLEVEVKLARVKMPYQVL